MVQKRNYYLLFIPTLLVLSIVISLLAMSISDSLFEVSMLLLIDLILWFVVLLWSILLMFQKGTFNKSLWKRPALISIGLLFIGFLFKFKDWAGWEIIILVSCLIVLLSYVMHFIKKKKKILLDYSKVLFVLSAFILSLFLSFHLHYLVSICCIILQLNLIIVFYYHLYRQKNTLR
jgi:hypothetical protein